MTIPGFGEPHHHQIEEISIVISAVFTHLHALTRVYTFNIRSVCLHSHSALSDMHVILVRLTFDTVHEWPAHHIRTRTHTHTSTQKHRTKLFSISNCDYSAIDSSIVAPNSSIRRY